LCMELANNEKPPESRRLAGILLKNTLSALVSWTKLLRASIHDIILSVG
jgi:hypothetical protein